MLPKVRGGALPGDPPKCQWNESALKKVPCSNQKEKKVFPLTRWYPGGRGGACDGVLHGKCIYVLIFSLLFEFLVFYLLCGESNSFVEIAGYVLFQKHSAVH